MAFERRCGRDFFAVLWPGDMWRVLPCCGQTPAPYAHGCFMPRPAVMAMAVLCPGLRYGHGCVTPTPVPWPWLCYAHACAIAMAVLRPCLRHGHGCLMSTPASWPWQCHAHACAVAMAVSRPRLRHGHGCVTPTPASWPWQCHAHACVMAMAVLRPCLRHGHGCLMSRPAMWPWLCRAHACAMAMAVLRPRLQFGHGCVTPTPASWFDLRVMPMAVLWPDPCAVPMALFCQGLPHAHMHNMCPPGHSPGLKRLLLQMCPAGRLKHVCFCLVSGCLCHVRFWPASGAR